MKKSPTLTLSLNKKGKETVFLVGVLISSMVFDVRHSLADFFRPDSPRPSLGKKELSGIDLFKDAEEIRSYILSLMGQTIQMPEKIYWEKAEDPNYETMSHPELLKKIQRLCPGFNPNLTGMDMLFQLNDILDQAYQDFFLKMQKVFHVNFDFSKISTKDAIAIALEIKKFKIDVFFSKTSLQEGGFLSSLFEIMIDPVWTEGTSSVLRKAYYEDFFAEMEKFKVEADRFLKFMRIILALMEYYNVTWEY